MFETLLVWRNHVVPLAEDPGVTTGAALGNFPQAYSMFLPACRLLPL